MKVIIIIKLKIKKKAIKKNKINYISYIIIIITLYKILYNIYQKIK